MELALPGGAQQRQDGVEDHHEDEEEDQALMQPGVPCEVAFRSQLDEEDPHYEIEGSVSDVQHSWQRCRISHSGFAGQRQVEKSDSEDDGRVGDEDDSEG